MPIGAGTEEARVRDEPLRPTGDAPKLAFDLELAACRGKVECGESVGPGDVFEERLQALDAEILTKLFLSYRDVSAWDEMVELYDKFPAALKDAVMARQQLALALNRRSGAGDRDRAIRVLEELLREHGESAATRREERRGSRLSEQAETERRKAARERRERGEGAARERR